MNRAPRIHGGPDAGGPSPHDFSTNANAAGPCPAALAAVTAADPRRYPDPQYRALREALADRHSVTPERIVPAASGSEAILRITARALQRGVRRVALPPHAYGDYRAAAEAWGLEPIARERAQAGDLGWACDPSSPCGQADPPADSAAAGIRVVDRAYAPLRLSGPDPWADDAAAPPGAVDRVWQLWTPNKALGLTGIRAAYLVAPAGQEEEAAALDRLAPSWAIGSHGVALLGAWCRPDTAAWLAQSLETLRGWKAAQLRLCEEDLGWHCLPSQANFFVVRLPPGSPADLPARLRAHGVRVRDCASFGLPGHLRLGVLPPAAQQALGRAVPAVTTTIAASRR